MLTTAASAPLAAHPEQAVLVTLLGAGDAFNSSGRCHAGHLISAPSASVLLDCGPTTLLALKREGIAAMSIDAVFISHLHGDHFAGLPFLFLESMFERPRQRPLSVVGPPGTEARVAQLYAAMYHDLSSRAFPFPLHFIETTPGRRARVGDVTFLAIEVPHQRGEISLGFRIEVEGKTIAYSGDTGWTEKLIALSDGADLFICECCYFETRVDFHLDYPRLAANHRRFGCNRLVLAHLGAEVLARADEVALELAHDGMVVEL